MLHDFCWGDTSKCVFTQDRALTTEQRNNSNQVCLGAPMSLLWLLTGAWLTQMQLQHKKSLSSWQWVVRESYFPRGSLLNLQEAPVKCLLSSVIVYSLYNLGEDLENLCGFWASKPPKFHKHPGITIFWVLQEGMFEFSGKSHTLLRMAWEIFRNLGLDNKTQQIMNSLYRSLEMCLLVAMSEE